MQPVEVVPVESKKIACAGGEGPLGHPKVYLNMGEKTAIDCPYCGRQFVYQPQALQPPKQAS